MKPPMRVARIDGSTAMHKRQQITKDMNAGEYDVCLISTRAGGLGLNIPGANRVILVDFSWNPQHEIQAIGRAYRLGQQKEVFVYHLVTAGTFEEKLHQITIFKQQLAARVVDKKTPNRAAVRVRDLLFEPEKTVAQEDLSHALQLDNVLDSILGSNVMRKLITSITTTDTLHKEADEALTAEEEAEVQQMIQEDRERKADPEGWRWKQLLEQRRQPNSTLPTHPWHAQRFEAFTPTQSLQMNQAVTAEPQAPLPTQTPLEPQPSQQKLDRVSTLPPPPATQVNAGGVAAVDDGPSNDTAMEDLKGQEPIIEGGPALGMFKNGFLGSVRNMFNGDNGA